MPKVNAAKKYVKQYTEHDIERAIEAVLKGMSKLAASKQYGVPRATIQFRMSSSFSKSRPGPPTVLTESEESILVEWIITSSRKGFPRRKEDVLNSVESFLKSHPRPNPLIDNRPGEGWYKLFLKRHPEISVRTAEAVTAASANVSETNVRKWFQQIELYLTENGYMNILKNPKRVYNGDETCFQLCPQNSKVLAPKGARDVYEVDHAQAKTCLTVMFTFSGNGDVTPPMIIYPLKRIRAEIRQTVPPSWGIGLSDNGWMNKDLFLQYIENVFHPHLQEQNVQMPIILFVDGHKSHINFELSRSCQNLGIILIALYPNATRILQPADVAAFKPIKTAWKKGVLEWRRENLSKTLTKVDFAPILNGVLRNHILKDSLINGFRACGLCPWNPNAINYSKCLGSKTTDTPETQVVTNPEIHLTLISFKQLVGVDVINALEKEKNIEDRYIKALLKVYRALQGEKAVDKSTTSEWDANPDLFDAGDEFSQIQCDKLDVFIENMLLNDDENKPKSFDSMQILDTTAISQPYKNNDHITIDDNEDFNNSERFLNEDNTDQNIERNDIRTSNIAPLTETPKKPLRDVLTWPKTPTKKGKQVTEKPTYVLTSNEWLRQEKEKLMVKETKEQEKQDRKRLREENKNNKMENILQKKRKKMADKTKRKTITDANDNTDGKERNGEEKTENSKNNEQIETSDKIESDDKKNGKNNLNLCTHTTNIKSKPKDYEANKENHLSESDDDLPLTSLITTKALIHNEPIKKEDAVAEESTSKIRNTLLRNDVKAEKTSLTKSKPTIISVISLPKHLQRKLQQNKDFIQKAHVVRSAKDCVLFKPNRITDGRTILRTEEIVQYLNESGSQ